jgi:hypothetical protein
VIKLKQLLEEARVGGWTTPKETPSIVITVLHQIVAGVIKQNKNSNDYIKLYHPTDYEWIIKNPKNSNILLVYNAAEHVWWAVGWPSDSHQKEVGIIDGHQLLQIIETWV